MQENSDSAIAEPLLWGLVPISHCPLHRLPLAMAYSDWRERPEGSRPIAMPSHCRWDLYESWRITESLKLLAYSCNHPGEFAQSNAPRRFLLAYMEHRGYQVRDLVRLTRTTHGNLQRYLSGQMYMSLKTVFELAQQLAVAPVDIFFGPETAATSALLFDESAHANEATRHLSRTAHPRRPKAVLAQMRRRLKALLDSRRPLPPFKQICTKAGVSTGYVRHKLPTESAAYLRRLKRECAFCRMRRKKEARAHALQLIAKRGIPSNLRQAEQVLREETGLPKALLAKTLQSIVNGMRKPSPPLTKLSDKPVSSEEQ